MLRRCSFLVGSFVSLFLITGCDCAGAPRPGCTTTADCATGLVCRSSECVLPNDAGGMDSGSDATTSDAFVPNDTRFDAACVPVTCADVETCFDGVDGDCDDVVDEGCSCVPGSTTRCLPGRPDPSTPRCAWGEMTCEGAGEFGEWASCVGAGASDGGSSLYGCRRIGIMGAPGANPSANFQGWLEMQGAIATRFHASSDAPTLRREELETFDLVVVDWLQRTYSTEEATTLADWVRAGGALLVMTGHDSGATADRHVSLLAVLGPTYDLAAGPLSGPATLVAHPINEGAEGAEVSFYGGLRVIVPEPLDTDITPMAVIDDQIVGAAGPLGDGRVLIFGDEWIEFDSEWSTIPAILAFWQSSVSWLAPDEEVLPACP